MSRPMKKRITPTLVGNEDDASIRLTARQIAAEEAKANKAQAEFQAKRRTEANLKKKQLKRKKQQLKRKREEDESPPPPQEINNHSGKDQASSQCCSKS